MTNSKLAGMSLLPLRKQPDTASQPKARHLAQDSEHQTQICLAQRTCSPLLTGEEENGPEAPEENYLLIQKNKKSISSLRSWA